MPALHARRRLTPLVVLALLATVLWVAIPAERSFAATTTYTASNEIFANPDRGFYSRIDLMNDPASNTWSHAKAAGNVLHSYVRLDPYRTTAIPQSFLDTLEQRLAKVRDLGFKIIPRFAYNHGPWPNCEPDASEAQIKAHLQQLAPLLARNADVLTSVEAGFIGCWGEWHTSTNGLETNNQAKTNIWDAILDAVPVSRQVALRYPSDMRLVMGSPISASEAFSGSHKSRTGSHQDCFLASNPDDWGTWGRNGGSVEGDKQFIAQNGLYAVVGGETCNLDSPRANCETARAELERFHFSYLNEDYEPQVIARFKQQGCFDEFKRRLGYRFALKSATYPTAIGRGNTFALQAVITNSGYASPFNQRPVFAILDGPGGRHTFPLNTDPRRWTPGTDTTVNAGFTVPTSVPTGTYRLALWLPDQYSSLRNRPEYAIRFANQNVWEASSGLNVLATNISVTNDGGTGNTAPSVPGNVQVTGTTPSTATLSWSASTDDLGIGGYRVYRNGTHVATVNATSYTDTGLTPDTEYTYRVAAEDIAGLTSAQSAPATARTTRITLLLDDSFAGYPGKNKLDKWSNGGSFVNGVGTVANGQLTLQYNDAGWYGSEIGRDVSQFSHLVVRVKGAAGGEQNHFNMTLGGVTKRFSQWTTTAITTSYQDVRVPLVANGVNRTSPGTLNLNFWQGAGGSITIDQIWFE